MVEPQSCATGASPVEAAVMHGLGVSAFQSGKVEAALKFMSRACADPEAPAVWHRNHAEILDRCGNSEAAEAAARLALLRDPDYAAAWETLGTILVQRGKHAESCSCCSKVLEEVWARQGNRVSILCLESSELPGVAALDALCGPGRRRLLKSRLQHALVEGPRRSRRL